MQHYQPFKCLMFLVPVYRISFNLLIQSLKDDSPFIKNVIVIFLLKKTKK